MKRKAAEAEAEAAEIGLLASRRNGPSQQVNAPTITITTADVSGSTSDPVKGGEKELGIQDEENLKSKGALPVINWSAGSKDSLQDQTKNDTYISNYDETTEHERDELMKEADLETGNKRVPATFRKQTRSQRRSKHKRRRSLEHKERELGGDKYITKGDELKEVDHHETENKRVPFWRKLIAYRPWKSKPSSSDDLERKDEPNIDDLGDDSAEATAPARRRSCKRSFPEPNPGIKRPPVTVFQPPPPPPPPTL